MLGIVMLVMAEMKNFGILVIIAQIAFITVLIGEFLAKAIFYSFSKQMDVGIG